MLHTIYRDPFALGHPQIYSIGEGCTLGEIVKRTPGLPRDFGWTGHVTVNGELVFREHWDRIRPKDGTVVAMHAHIGGGGDGGGAKQIIGLVAAIALSVVTGGIAAGALAPFLGASFAAGTIGASVLAGAVGLAGALAISALTAPPTAKPGAEQAQSGLRLEAASVDGNLLEANTPVPRVVGTRKAFPPFLTEPIIELIGQDEYVEAVYGLAGPHDLTDIRLGDATIDLETDGQKDIDFEIRYGLPGESSVTLTARQGRTTEPNISMSVHTVDPEDQSVIDGVGVDKLPVFHAVTTRIAPDENWIHFALTGLVKQENPESLRIPFRMRMRSRGSDTWIDLPEIHYMNDTQSQLRLQFKIFWGEAWTDSLPVPPATVGFVEARKLVPAQDVQPLGTIFESNSYFSAGSGNDVYRNGTESTTNVRNVLLYSERVEIYLDTDTFEPGIWDIEIKRGATFENDQFNSTLYEYNAEILDFFGRRDTGVMPLTREGLLDNVSLVRLVNIWNEHPINEAGMTLIAIKARNRSVSKLSAIASGYVLDLPHGKGPVVDSVNDFFLSRDVSTAADVEVLALIRPLTVVSADNPEAIRVALRVQNTAGSRNLYQFGFRNMTAGDGAFNAVAIDRFVNGSGVNVLNETFNWELNRNYFLRFRASGTLLQGKAWPATIAEPDDWTIELTDANVTGDGLVGISGSNGSGTGKSLVNWFSVGLNGESAPMPPASVTVISDPATRVLMHFNAPSDNNPTFIDSSVYQRQIVTVGNTHNDTAQSKFSGSAGLFDGTGDYLRTADAADLEIGSQDFTAEAWFYVTVTGGSARAIMGKATDGFAAGWLIRRESATSRIAVYMRESSLAGSAFLTGTTQFTDVLNPGWHHVALVRHGVNWYLFIDGVIEATRTESFSIADNAAVFGIGTWGTNGGSDAWQGWIDELRLSIGIARYTAAFTPPTAPFTVYEDQATDFSHYEVNSSALTDPCCVLLHFDGTDASTTFTDSCTSPNTFTASGNAQLDTAQSQFGGSSGLFDGTGDYISCADGVNLELRDNDFTIDFWFRANHTGLGSVRGFLGKFTGYDGNNHAFAAFLNASNITEFSFGDGTSRTIIVGTTPFDSITNPGWHHYAVVRRADEIRLFIDGVMEASTTFTGSILNSTDTLVVGSGNATLNPYTGWIDELRIAIGESTWWDDFTPPTAPHTIANDGWTRLRGTVSAQIVEDPSLPYNGGATEWTEFRTTSNPAPHFRDILTGSLNFDPLPSALLDDPSLVAWRARNAACDFTCDMVVEGLEVPDLLRVVSSCGYGRLYRSELFGVIQDYDRSNDTPVQVFSPRNSSGLSWRKAFSRLPAGFRINFREEDLDYGSDQVIVYRSDIEGTSARLEQVSYDGLIRRDDVIRRAEFDLLQGERRAAFYTFNAPVESIVCRRGDLIGVNSDILQSQYGYGRITDVIYDEDQVAGIVLDSVVEVFNEPDFNEVFDILAEDDVLTLGMVSAIAIRQTDNQIMTYQLDENTETGETDTLMFSEPVAVRPGYVSPFDKELVKAIAPECLVVIGELGNEYRRFVISEVAPQTNLEAQLVCVDEASEMFAEVFGG